MTKEQLLKTRWKVIADFPDSDYKLGEILDRDWTKYVNSEDKSKGIVWKISDFPHLFEKLNWWEDINQNDLPKYIYQLDSKGINKIWKVFIYVFDYEIRIPNHLYEPYIITDDNYRWQIPLTVCLPSTENEYLSQMKSM